MTAASSHSPMTVFIVEDDAAIRESVCNLLETEHIPAVSFPSAEAFIAAWHEGMCGCLLLDVRLPGITGIELQDKFRILGIGIPIIFMTAHGDIPMVRKVMKAGAIEFLTKPFHRQELIAGIEHAFERDSETRRQNAMSQHVRDRYQTLSPREREVMAQVTAGLLNKQVAANLELSEITVKLHRRHVMEKMHADSLADLVRMADALLNKAYTKA